MRLGFAVKVLGEPEIRSHDTRRWQSGPHLRVSLGYLEQTFAYLARAEISMYRMASSLAPYASHPGLPQFHDQVAECREELRRIGRLARDQDLRLSMHPGQYTVLNSARESVVSAAVAELEVQASLLDALDSGPEAVCVIHVGSAAGGVEAASDRFLFGFDRLSERARRRVALENDDRLFSLCSVNDLAKRAQIPVVFDQHHHFLHNPEACGEREALELAFATWPRGVRPKVHFSSPDLKIREQTRRSGRRVERKLVLPDPRHHADLIDPVAFIRFLEGSAKGLDFDVMLEAKGKDLALLRLRKQIVSQEGLLSTDLSATKRKPARRESG